MQRTKRFRPNAVTILACAAALGLLVCGPAARAVDIQGVQEAAADQPSINAMVQPVAGGNPYTFSFEGFQTFNIPAYLDTGTSGVVISGDTASLWGVPLENGVTFSDVAVGGTTDYQVTQPLNIRLAPSNSTDVDNLSTFQSVYGPSISNVRIQAGPLNADPNALSLDVFGMPVLAGKTMVSDARGLNDGSDFLRTYIYGPNTPYNPATSVTNPGIPTTNHHVAMSYGDFSRFTSIDDPTGHSAPVFTHNPFIGPDPLATSPSPNSPPPVSISFGGLHTSGSFLFDTGAQVSFISSNLAGQLHVRYVPGTDGTDHPQLETFDPNHPELAGTAFAAKDQFTLPIQGIGGASVSIAGFFLDSLTLHTIEGSAVDSNPNNINYVGAPVFIYDITVQDPNTLQSVTLDGDLGMNFMFASMSEKPGADGFPIDGPQVSGAFNWVTFDEPNGILGLDLISVPEPGSFILAAIGGVFLALFARRRSGR